MVFEALKIRFSTILRSPRSLSRTMRRHFAESVKDEQLWREAIWPALETARQRGDVDEIHRQVMESHKLLREKGDLLLLDDEKRDIGLEIKFEKKLDDLPRFFHELKQVVMSSGLDQEEKGRLNAAINEAKVRCKKMYALMQASIQKQYTSAFAETRAKSGGDEHRVLAERIGLKFESVAEASKHMYKLRDDYRDEKKDVNAIQALVETMEREVAEADRQHAKAARIYAKLGKQEKTLVEDVQKLLDHVQVTMQRFTLIMQVFTTYYYTIRRDENLLRKFLADIRAEGFPQREMERLTSVLDADDKSADERAQQVADALARIRRPVQQADEMLDAA